MSKLSSASLSDNEFEKVYKWLCKSNQPVNWWNSLKYLSFGYKKRNNKKNILLATVWSTSTLKSLQMQTRVGLKKGYKLQLNKVKKTNYSLIAWSKAI